MLSPIALPSRPASHPEGVSEPADARSDARTGAQTGAPGEVTNGRAGVSIPLTQLPRGRRARVHSDNLDAADFAQVRAMGLHPNATVEVCSLGRHCIVALTGSCGGGCRIGLSKDLADRVMVEPNA